MYVKGGSFKWGLIWTEHSVWKIAFQEGIIHMEIEKKGQKIERVKGNNLARSIRAHLNPVLRPNRQTRGLIPVSG